MNSQYISILVALVVAGLTLSQPVFAGDDSCGNINWKPRILARFASIDQACQEVVVRDGKRFARFEVKLVRVRTNGSVTVSMKLRNGSRVEGVFFAPRDLQILSNSELTSFHMNELSPGDILDVYIPQSRIENATLGEGSA